MYAECLAKPTDNALLGHVLAVHCNVVGKIRAHGKGRVDVNQFQSALFFNLLPHGTVHQR